MKQRLADLDSDLKGERTGGVSQNKVPAIRSSDGPGRPSYIRGGAGHACDSASVLWALDLTRAGRETKESAREQARQAAVG